VDLAALTMQTLVDMLQNANAALKAGQLDTAHSMAQEVLKEAPNQVPALHIAGLAKLQSGHAQDAITYLAQAASLDGTNKMLLMHLGVAYGATGDEEKAAESFRQVITVDPDFLAAYGNLGLALSKLSRFEEAESVYRSLLERDSDNAMALEGMGRVLIELGRDDDAVEVLRATLRANSKDKIAHSNLGTVLTKLGEHEAAVSHLEEAHKLDPENADILVNLGKAYRFAGRRDDAVAAFRRAIRSDPNHPQAHNELGVVLEKLGRLSEAAEAYQNYMKVVPGNAMAHNNLGNVYSQMGHIGDAEKAYADALEAKPDYPVAHSNYVLNLNYWPDRSVEDVFQEHRSWAARYEPVPSPVLPPRQRGENDRIRIGYFSPDFKRHPVAHFLAPILQAHDRSRFEIFCYAEVPSADSNTAKFMEMSDHWRWTHTQSDDDLYRTIREDDLDLIVDLAGHTGNNRLPVIARRVAPVQVSWLGYPNTTGLETMDFRFSDAIADPEGDADRFCSETLYRLPETFLCLALENEPLPAMHPPSVDAGYITFGSFNNLSKMNEPLVDAWAEVLRRVPSSRVVLKCRQLADDQVRDRYRSLFVDRGIEAHRVELIAWIPDRTSHLTAYAPIDIALDTFPYTGTTTTCEAMWMGVPVITLRGDRHAGRVGASLVSTIGHTELIAEDMDSYINLAVDLSSDSDRLATYRAALRNDMAQSPLCDVGTFTRALEDAYRDMIGS